MPATRRRRTLFGGVGVVAVGAVLVWLWASGRFEGSAAAERARPAGAAAVPVSVSTATQSDVPLRLDALGSVAAFNTVTVRPRVDGELMRVAFREGQLVKRGDLLAVIDPRPFDVQLEQALGQLARDQAQLASARVDFTRYQTLWEQDSIARQIVDAQASTVAQLEAALKVDQAAIDSARLNLTYSRVTAPIGGRVGLRLVDQGNVVIASNTAGIVVITQIEPISVVFTLPEDTLPLVLPRLRAGVALPVDAYDRSGTKQLATGQATILDNQVDPTTGSVRVKATFANRDHALFPSQFVNVRLLADTARAQLVVPASAVQHGPQGTFVYRVSNGSATARPVSVGIVDAERASIVTGLAAGDVVVIAGADRLRDGSAVEVRQ